jgi:hypothetical protein
MAHGTGQAAVAQHLQRHTLYPVWLRRAGYGTLAATALLVLGAVALGIYFGSAEVGNIFGPISDVLYIGVMVLLIPAVLAVRTLVAGRTGAWFTVMSGVAITGLLITAAGQALLVVGAIPLEASFVTFGVGLALFLAWGVALWVPAFRHGVLPRSVAAWPAAAVVLLVLASIGWFALPQPVGYVLALALGVAALGWLVSLGRLLVAVPDRQEG